MIRTNDRIQPAESILICMSSSFLLAFVSFWVCPQAPVIDPLPWRLLACAFFVNWVRSRFLDYRRDSRPLILPQTAHGEAAGAR